MWIIVNITLKNTGVLSREITAVITCRNQASHSTTNYMEQRVHETTWATRKQATGDKSSLHLPHATMFSVPDLSQRAGGPTFLRVWEQ